MPRKLSDSFTECRMNCFVASQHTYATQRLHAAAAHYTIRDAFSCSLLSTESELLSTVAIAELYTSYGMLHHMICTWMESLMQFRQTSTRV